MPRRLTLVAIPLALAACLLLPSLAAASVPSGAPSPWDSDDGPRPTAVTSSVTCVIVEVREDRTLLVRDEEGREHQVRIPEKAKIKPRRKRQFDGLKQLEFGHLRPGFELKLTFLQSNGQVVRVKVLDVDAEAA